MQASFSASPRKSSRTNPTISLQTFNRFRYSPENDVPPQEQNRKIITDPRPSRVVRVDRNPSDPDLLAPRIADGVPARLYAVQERQDPESHTVGSGEGYVAADQSCSAERKTEKGEAQLVGGAGNVGDLTVDDFLALDSEGNVELRWKMKAVHFGALFVVVCLVSTLKAFTLSKQTVSVLVSQWIQQ